MRRPRSATGSANRGSWVRYSGGWDDALTGCTNTLFEFHHQPFAYFANYGDGTLGRVQQLKDEQDLLLALAQGAVRAVSFIKLLGPDNAHPGYASLCRGNGKNAGISTRWGVAMRSFRASPLHSI